MVTIYYLELMRQMICDVCITGNKIYVCSHCKCSHHHHNLLNLFWKQEKEWKRKLCWNLAPSLIFLSLSSFTEYRAPRWNSKFLWGVHWKSRQKLQPQPQTWQWGWGRASVDQRNSKRLVLNTLLASCVHFIELMHIKSQAHIYCVIKDY